MGREEGSGWGTHVYLWQIHFDIWQKQYNIVKLNKIKLKKKKNKFDQVIKTFNSKKYLHKVNLTCAYWIIFRQYGTLGMFLKMDGEMMINS